MMKKEIKSGPAENLDTLDRAPLNEDKQAWCEIIRKKIEDVKRLEKRKNHPQ